MHWVNKFGLRGHRHKRSTKDRSAFEVSFHYTHSLFTPSRTITPIFQKIFVSSVNISVIILDSQGSWENEVLFQMYLAKNKTKMMATIFSCDCEKVTPHLLVQWCVSHGPRCETCCLRRCEGSLESLFLILNQVVLSICSSYFHLSFELGLTRGTLVFGESFGVKKQVEEGNRSRWGLLTTNK